MTSPCFSVRLRCNAAAARTQRRPRHLRYAPAMKTSTERILTTHVGSIPRPDSVRSLLRARLAGQRIDEAELAARATEAVADVVRRQGEVGLDVVSDGEMSKTSFLGYTDDRLSGFVSTTASTDPSAAL